MRKFLELSLLLKTKATSLSRTKDSEKQREIMKSFFRTACDMKDLHTYFCSMKVSKEDEKLLNELKHPINSFQGWSKVLLEATSDKKDWDEGISILIYNTQLLEENLRQSIN